MTGRKVLFIGGSSVDILLQIPRLPAPGEKLVSEFAGHQGGGMIANAACAASRLGMDAAWTGELANDEYGQLMVASFNEFNVSTSSITFRNWPSTDFTVVLLEPSGERTILVVPTTTGPPILSPEALDLAGRASAVYTMPQPIEWFRKLADRVHTGGGMIAVDVEASSPVRTPELEIILSMSDIVFCSRDGFNLAAAYQHFSILKGFSSHLQCIGGICEMNFGILFKKFC